ncbi:MAG: hypothetical protein AAF660_14390 [Pseudomonadota bacterium]
MSADGYSDEVTQNLPGQVAPLIRAGFTGVTTDTDGRLSVDAESAANTSDVIPRVLSKVYAQIGQVGLYVVWP